MHRCGFSGGYCLSITERTSLNISILSIFNSKSQNWLLLSSVDGILSRGELDWVKLDCVELDCIELEGSYGKEFSSAKYVPSDGLMPAVCLNPIGIEILRFLTVRFFLDFFVKNFQSFFSLPSSAESQQTLLSHILVLIRYCLGKLLLSVQFSKQNEIFSNSIWNRV